jgi:spore coat protein U-like protein
MTRTWLLAALAFGILPAASVHAATCTARVTPLVFGAVTGGTSTRITATVRVTCSTTMAGAVSYEILLGTGSSGNYAQRTMHSSHGTLAYQLYNSATLTQVWGDGTAGTATVRDAYTLPANASRTVSYTVYGQALGQQEINPAQYSDAISVSLR